MKIIVLLFLVTSFMANTSVLSAEKGRSLLDKLFNRLELPKESQPQKLAMEISQSEQAKKKTNKNFFNNNDNSQNIFILFDF